MIKFLSRSGLSRCIFWIWACQWGQKRGGFATVNFTPNGRNTSNTFCILMPTMILLSVLMTTPLQAQNKPGAERVGTHSAKATTLSDYTREYPGVWIFDFRSNFGPTLCWAMVLLRDGSYLCLPYPNVPIPKELRPLSLMRPNDLSAVETKVVENA